MKKGQAGNVIIYVSVVIIAAFILYFGFTQVSKITLYAKEGELISFVKNLEKSLEANMASSANRAGSIKEEVFLLPENIESVCFVDETRGYNLLVNPELNEQIKNYEGYNLYFKPSTVMPKKVGYLELDKSNNPLCIKTISGKIALKLISGKGKTQIDAAELNKKTVNCVLADGVSDPQNNIDIAFLGYGYDNNADKEIFREDARKYINDIFFSIEPFKSNKDKFTFYLIDEFEDLDCSFRNWIECDDVKVKQLASNCPHDYIIILASRSRIADFVNPIRSSAIGNIEKINTADNPNVLVHEFGHIFGGLADEYVDDRYYGRVDFREEDYPNCDSEGCDKWKGLTMGCFKECSLSSYYRPTKSSIMRNLNHNYFGPVNENALNEKFGSYGGER